MRNLLKEYRVELIALLIALLGFFLLVEQFEIRASAREGLLWLWEKIKTLAQQGLAFLADYITSFTLSDFIGWILIILTASFITWRGRYRFLRSRFWRIEACPRCGGQLQRIHRTRFDRFLTAFWLPHGRRYQCKDEDCRWSGLRRRIHRDRSDLLE